MFLYIIKNTIKSEYRFILVYIINTIILILIFNMILEYNYVSYPLFLSIIFMICYLIKECMNNYKLSIDVEQNKIANNIVSYPISFKDKLYLDLISDLHLEYSRKVNNHLEQNKRSEILFSQFIHNMKTSVSVIEIASTIGIERTDNNSILEDIRIENIKLKEQLEQCLNVLRLE